ncbi:aminoacyl-tRNA hydrolase [Holzapfeliella floricola]|uniref:Peptidyl-tRNA hydrolase n=1 Tax=Holzapfeliella floricola DSM 23037 = JCM 16512 TaxID=1423744 RepID=A0A0R2DR78_9LACO|nr:aminoacyl-tRNA hydrolase [Holzapfeliella floricola]KRN04309.1 peptidyl-tRNA hydrolase [Holzapfeliella floricola DSM 23037 = JCM 16512]
MKLIVGLGNPGNKYQKTKHNVGFMAIDKFCDSHHLNLDSEKFMGSFTKTVINGESVILAEPLTYMNDSGRHVSQLANFFKIDPEDILVIQDDMDLPMAKIRLRQSGSAGGHNGIKSIINGLGTKSFPRLKVGIKHPENATVVNWVLSPFTGEDAKAIDDSLETVVEILEKFITGEAMNKLMNQYN